ncbi:hypothetical protein [Oerskovia jenensis]|uniref:hypothetical protein n=1 Tax=Oerskovia jenensis TaxID=162169 RepID=UPI0036DB9DBA
MIHDTHVLSGAEAAPWARRPPRTLLPLLVVVVVLYSFTVAVMLEAGDGYATGPTLADVEGPWAAAISAAQGVLLASLGLVWAAPRATTWAAAAALAVLAGAPAPVVPADVWTAAAVLAVAATGSTLLAVHQRAGAAAWGAGRARVTPDTTPDARAHLQRLRPAPLVLGSLLVLAGAVGVAFAVLDQRAADQFRATADTGLGTVVGLTDGALVATVELDDGTRLEVPLPVTTPSVGDHVEVRFDRDSGRAERVDDVFDPTGALIPGAGGLLAGTVVLAGAATRRRDVHRLVEQGGPPLRLVATWSPGHRGVLLATVDDLRPFALVPHPVPTWPLHTAEPWEDDQDEGADDVPFDDDALLAEAARSALPDEGGLRFGLPCTDWRTTPVTVVGLVQDGRPAAVAGPDGHWYVGDLPVRGPAGIVDVLFRRRRPSVPDAGRHAHEARVDGETATDLETAPLPVGDREAWRAAQEKVDRRVTAPARRAAAATGAWLPYLLLVPCFLLVRWLAVDLTVPGVVTFVVAAVNFGAAWSHLARAQLSVDRDGLLVTGRLLDTRLPWSVVDRVVAGPDALVIRTTDAPEPESPDQAEDGAVLCPASDDALPLVGRTRDPEAARRRIEDARPPVGVGAPAGRITRRPASSLVVGLVWGAAVVAGWLLG